MKYTATTASKKDAVRWATEYPPNDERKRKKVEVWLNEIGEER